MNYAYSSKDSHWRRRVWNLFSANVSVHPRDAVCIYLAGPENLDREIAIKKGFCENNLIAVERDEGVCAALRSSGQLTICGDIWDVLLSWPDHVPVHAINADLCCGFEATAITGLRNLQLKAAFRDTVFAVNMQRGRDKSGNIIRNLFEEPPKHRGELLIGSLVALTISDFAQAGIYFDDESHLLLYRVFNRSVKGFTSYRSTTGVFFDGVVFTSTAKALSPENEVALKHFYNKETSRQIAAILAHRTRRIAA